MREVRILMDMPVTVEVVDDTPKTSEIIEKVYSYFTYIDNNFSIFKETSEISKINNGVLSEQEYTQDMRLIFKLCEETKLETNGYFDILRNGKLDPSGIVKGWAIYNAAQIIRGADYLNYYVDAGSDIQVNGKNTQGKKWRIGIKNPFNVSQIIKVLEIESQGVATSGNYLRGEHIYNPKRDTQKEIVSLTAVGPNIYEADRFATPAFAMGREGINFIEKLPGFEGYMIDKKGLGTETSGFHKYCV